MQQILALLTAKDGSKNAGHGGGGGGGNQNNNTSNNCNGHCKVSVKPNLQYKFYHWSHGIHPTHNSCNCNNKFPSHEDATVYADQMDGWEKNTPYWCGFVTP